MTNLPRMLMAAAGASSYDGIITLGAFFDGDGDMVSREALLTGLTDSKVGLLSFWFHPTTDDGVGGDGTFVAWTSGDSGASLNQRRSSNKIKMSYRGTGAEGVDHTTSIAILAASGWHHFLQSWNLDNTRTGGKVNYHYMDDVDDTGGATTDVDIHYEGSDPSFTVGANANRPNFGEEYSGDIAEFYFTNEFLDISSSTNRRKFITAGGNPADLGSDGSDGTGTQPLVYLRIAEGAAPATFGTNLGSGGAFSITGTLTASSTNPSD